MERSSALFMMVRGKTVKAFSREVLLLSSGMYLFAFLSMFSKL